MPRRGFGCLPLQRGGPPGITAGRLAVEQAPDHVEQEHHLGEAHDQCRHGDEDIQRRGRLRNESHIAHLEIPARHTQQAYIVHGEVNRIGPEERDPEVKLAEHLVQHSPGDLRVPVVDRTENHENGRHAHHHVKVGDNKHGVGQRNIHDWVAEEQPGQSPVHKRDDEGEGEQHRDREVNVAAPQREHPVVDLDGRWDGDDERGGGEEEPEIRVHAAHIHVVRPYDEAEGTDGDDRPHHHAIAEDVFSRMGADQVGDDAEGRYGDDVDLGMAEEPEEVLKQQRTAAAVIQVLSQLDNGRNEKAGPQDPVEQQHHAADEQGGEGQQRDDGGREDAPYRQGHAHQRHPPRARLQHRHHVVQPPHGEADDEQDQGGEHQNDAPVPPRSAGEDGLGRVQGPAGARGTSRREEARHQDQHREQIDPVAHHVHVGKNHVPGAHHQRDQVVSEAPQEQRGEQIDHHDHAVHGDELQVVSGADGGEAAREGQLQPYQPRQHQSHQSNRERSDRILDGDDFGVLGKDVFRHPAPRMIELYVFHFGGLDGASCANRDIDHWNALALYL